MNKERLLNVARALRESPNPEKFDMGLYAESCETPACAWGHYCARPDMQSEFMLDERGYPRTIGGGDAMLCDGTIIDDHFGLNSDQVVELFGANGCGEAQTAIEAAEYIEGFVAHHEERP